MINLEVRFPQSTDWSQTQHSGLSDKQSAKNPGMNTALNGQNSSSAMQDNPVLALLAELISSFLQQMQGQNAGSDHGGQGGQGGQSSSPFNQSGSANRAMEGLGNNLLKGAMEPSSNGGGQLSKASQPLQREVGKMMDNHQDTFGSPTTSAGNTSPSSNSGAGSTSSLGGSMFPSASKDPIVLDEPIVVKAGETFDGKGQTFTASSKLGDGGQSEHQKPLFELEDGATLKNVVLGDNEADGIHTHGDAKLDNVHWTDVGEDALTMKEGGRVEISNSSARNADDKIFQLNDDGTLILNNVQADNFGKLVRTNGGQQGDWDIQLNDVKATNGKHALVQSDSNTVKVTGNNVQTENVKGMYILPSSGSLTLN